VFHEIPQAALSYFPILPTMERKILSSKIVLAYGCISNKNQWRALSPLTKHSVPNRGRRISTYQLGTVVTVSPVPAENVGDDPVGVLSLLVFGAIPRGLLLREHSYSDPG
jgi:hypothetical protein